MCGIAGKISFSPLAEERLKASAEAMRHRGPDAQGLYQRGESDGSVSLAFRRLAIVDLSPDGNQPMTNETGDVVLIFNGEIYNYQELRRELESRHHFASHTDTETLVHGYEEWGLDGLLKRIDGMFAFALWDEKAQTLFFARDRVGKKPFYYHAGPDGFAFASTLNALRPLLPTPPALNPAALDAFLVYQAVPAPLTIYQNIFMLPPAHGGSWHRDDGLQTFRYWQLSYQSKTKRSEAALLDELDARLRFAIERRLMADVPLGAFLSGGVDSSLIVGLMSAMGAGPVEAVNIGFDDPQFDERPYARAVAERWKANLHEYVLPPDEVQNLPEILWHYGQPHADVSIVPTYAVARAARRHVTVVLNGDGGDEGFGGYARPLVARAAQTLRGLGPLSRPLTLAAKRGGKHGAMLAEATQGSARDAFVYTRGLRGLRDELYTPEFHKQLTATHPDAFYAAAWDAADGPTDADRALFGDLTTYLPDQLLTKMDVSTMAHSVEARSPLLDTALLEFAATIPISQLTRGYTTKILLKKLAERYVPAHVLYRRKKGFVMPAGAWLRGELAPIARALLSPRVVEARGWFSPLVVARLLDEHLSGTRNHADALWTLLVWELWQRLFVDETLGRCDPLGAVL